jgi:hypothetical protein
MTESSSGFTDFVLGQLRCASLRSRLQTCEIDAIVTGLNAGLVSVEAAVAWAGEIGAHLIASSSITLASSSS